MTKWTEYVKKYAADNEITYLCAVSEAGPSYRKANGITKAKPKAKSKATTSTYKSDNIEHRPKPKPYASDSTKSKPKPEAYASDSVSRTRRTKTQQKEADNKAYTSHLTPGPKKNKKKKKNKKR
jgi:hypothetical protein